MPRTNLLLPLAAAALAVTCAPALAATAHNSQAGSWGPTSHQCASTPYFQAGGCVSAAVEDERLYPFDVPPTPYRPGRRLHSPHGPIVDPFE